MKMVIKDGYGEGITVKTTVIKDDEFGDIKAIELETFSDSAKSATLELEQIDELIETLQKAREAIS
ncbi:hypothetical protein [Bacillus wiedmannii]|uniref:hypothetical protein n=1 Tax=Bacillus wiedmannii TaxID=1890302 RepID=UPI000BF118C0|nr:hypothetical protein [Bacillus wiedmannii]PEM30202.1 hypothetical protein CN598_12820 [Bacillus wiedmannii]